MSNYILTINETNKIATIHAETCSHLRSYPLDYSGPNGRRIKVDDGLEALAKAETAMPAIM